LTDAILDRELDVLSGGEIQKLMIALTLAKTDDELVTVRLQPRSVVILTGDARYKWTHSIAARKSDGDIARGRRISLTYRTVISV